MHVAKWKKVVAVVLLVLVIILVFQNTAEVETQVFFWTPSVPRALLLGTTGGLGIAIGYLAASLRHRKQASSETSEPKGPVSGA